MYLCLYGLDVVMAVIIFSLHEGSLWERCGLVSET